MNATESEVGFQGRGVNLAIVSMIFAVLAIAAVTGRVFTRITMKTACGWDDYVIILSLFFSMCFTALNVAGVAHGYGKAARLLAPNLLHPALQTFWACQIAYKLTLNLTKLSILLLYLRIFPNPGFRVCVKLVFVAISAYAFSTIVATILQCNPIARNWDRTRNGSCIDLVAFWYANAIANIASDVVIVALPTRLVWRLQLPRAQKWGLYVILSLGLFVCGASVMRMTVLERGANAADSSYNSLNSTIWSAVECNMAIICASLPMLKGALSYLFPRLFPRGQAVRGTTRVNPTRTAAVAPSTWQSEAEPNRFELWIRPEVHAGGANIPLASIKHSASEMYDIPLDVITKTTDIHVEFGGQADPSSASDSSGSLVAVPAPSRKTLPYPRK